MKRTLFISAAALMLASAVSFTSTAPANAYGWDSSAAYDGDADPYNERPRRSRQDWRDLMLDQMQNRQGLSDLSGNRWRGREKWSDSSEDDSGSGHCMSRRAGYGDLRAGRKGPRDVMADRGRSQDDLQDWILDRMERRALLREMLARQTQREDDWGGRASSRFEGAEENGGGAAITRADLRDLILARIRSNGQFDQLLEQIQDRIDGED